MLAGGAVSSSSGLPVAVVANCTGGEAGSGAVFQNINARIESTIQAAMDRDHFMVFLGFVFMVDSIRNSCPFTRENPQHVNVGRGAICFFCLFFCVASVYVFHPQRALLKLSFPC